MDNINHIRSNKAMIKAEFERIAGYEVSEADYNDIIEPMYMSTDLSKEEFVKTIAKDRFEFKAKKTAARQRIEGEAFKEIAELKQAIEYNRRRIEMLNEFIKEGDKSFKAEVIYLKTENAEFRERIKWIKWAIA